MEQPRSSPYRVPPTRVYTASLAQKLGILRGASRITSKPWQIDLIGAPKGFVELLDDLPATVSFTSRLNAKTHLALCFIRSWEDLAATLDLLTFQLPEKTSTWIVYTKRTIKKHLDFNESDVRESALTAELVNYKVCSIEAGWSAMKFAHRKMKSSQSQH